MRIVSFLPSGTEIVLALGAGDQIVGVSHDHRSMAAVRHLPTVSHLGFEERGLSAREMDAVVSAAYARRESIYRVDPQVLGALQPDLLITQELCQVCAVTPDDFQKALSGLEPMPLVLSLNAHTLAEARDEIRRTAAMLGLEAAGARLLADGDERLAAVERALPAAGPRPRVVCLEWPDPLYNAGHWVPEMVALAGGREVLGRPGEASQRLDWETLGASQPEVLVLLFCDLERERALAEARALTRLPGWAELPAVRTGRVWVVDGPRHFSKSGPGLIAGIEVLARLLHPGRFSPCRPEDAVRLEGA